MERIRYIVICGLIIIWSSINYHEIKSAEKAICKAINEAHSKPECIKQGEFKEGE